MAHKAKAARQRERRSASNRSAGREGAREYFDRAMLENQPRLTDLIPKSRWAYFAMLLLGVICIYSCQQAFLHTRVLVGTDFPTHLFDINGAGNVASWSLSVMLLLLSVGAIMIYLLRRHKTDDYKGRYRLWLHLAMIAAVLSFEVATDMHQILMVPLAQMEFPAPWSDASIWWLALVSLMSAHMAIRLLIEFKSRPGMLTLLSVLAVVLIAAGCSRMGSVIGESALTTEVAQSSLLMSATLLATWMTWLNARKVYLTAQAGTKSGHPQAVVRERNEQPVDHQVAEAREEVEQSYDEQDADWDDWDELDNEFEQQELAEVAEDYEEYAEEDLNEFDEQEAVDDEYEILEYEEEVEEPEVEEPEVEYEEAEEQQYEEEQATEEEETEEVIYSAYAADPEETQEPTGVTTAEPSEDESQQKSLLIPPKDEMVEYEPFDEDAFWEQYDLTKMSRKQLKTMRKKLNRLKRKHAERQRAA